VATSLREAAASIDPTVAVSDVRTGEQLVSTVVAPSRFTTFVLGAFAAIALALAAIGIYGVLSYSVTRRSREIGLRVALGAHRGDVLRLVLGHALVLAVAGTIVGLAAALACTPLLQTLLFGVGSRDLVTFSVVPLLLLSVSALAAYVPARKALDIDPATTLRLE
jgi:putative ABC transport system permease protein